MPNRKKKLSTSVLWICFLSGTALLTLNLYGLTKDIRVTPIPEKDLRFPNDQALDFDVVLEQLERRQGEEDLAYAERLNSLISQGLAHIEWHSLPPSAYNMRIPPWENYFISFLGHFSGIPEYKRYHFMDPIRSLERGIGICGDASMVLSQRLDKAGIKNEIISFPGHVVVAVHINGKEHVLDPDYGINLGVSLEEMQQLGINVGKLYSPKFSLKERRIMSQVLNHEYKRWDDVQAFVTKKYYFEHASYFLKWALPIILLIVSGSIICVKGSFCFKRDKRLSN